MACLAVDVMGGDLGPHFVLRACRAFLTSHRDVSLRLFVDQTAVKDAKALQTQFPDRVLIESCSCVVSPEETAMSALRTKRQSTMAMALKSTQQEDVLGVLSLGNTAALVALSRHFLSLFPGVDRPALATYLPTQQGQVLMLDLGATVHSTVEQLTQFAVMGLAWRSMQGHGKHQMALLNMGVEECKGPEEIRLASQLFSSMFAQEYVGFCEPNQVWTSALDVVVCSGLVGNTLLKSAEGVAELLLTQLESSQSTSWWTRLRRRLLPPAATISDWYGKQPHGALLLGVNGLVVKGHGCSGEAQCLQALQFLHQQSASFDSGRLMAEMILDESSTQ